MGELAVQGLSSTEPNALIILGFSFFGGNIGFRVKGESGDGLKLWTPFLDGSFESPYLFPLVARGCMLFTHWC